MPMINTENYAAFGGCRNGKADGLAGGIATPCMPAACGVYATFGWTALVLAPHMVGIFMRSGSPGTAQGAALNIIANIIAVIIVTLPGPYYNLHIGEVSRAGAHSTLVATLCASAIRAI
jgi:hypothetical protein